MIKLLIVGGGQMGTALLAGLLDRGVLAADECVICEVSAATHERLHKRFPGVAVETAPIPAEAVVIAVKPTDVEAACRSLQPGSYLRVLSIAAGVTTETLERYLAPGVAVIRAMPNTPALVGAAASAVSAGSSASLADLEWAEAVLSAVGLVVRLPERLLDAVTGLSGSGPAYLFLVAEALIDAGVLAGLSRDVSRELAVQTILGSARLLAEGGEPPEQLRAAVTSPGGTTAAALQVLERAGIRAAFLDAVLASAARAKELAEPH